MGCHRPSFPDELHKDQRKTASWKEAPWKKKDMKPEIVWLRNWRVTSKHRNLYGWHYTARAWQFAFSVASRICTMLWMLTNETSLYEFPSLFRENLNRNDHKSTIFDETVSCFWIQVFGLPGVVCFHVRSPPHSDHWVFFFSFNHENQPAEKWTLLYAGHKEKVP